MFLVLTLSVNPKWHEKISALSLQVNCEGRLQEGMQGFLQLPWRLVQSENLVTNLCMSDIVCRDIVPFGQLG